MKLYLRVIASILLGLVIISVISFLICYKGIKNTIGETNYWIYLVEIVVFGPVLSVALFAIAQILDLSEQNNEILSSLSDSQEVDDPDAVLPKAGDVIETTIPKKSATLDKMIPIGERGVVVACLARTVMVRFVFSKNAVVENYDISEVEVVESK